MTNPPVAVSGGGLGGGVGGLSASLVSASANAMLSGLSPGELGP